MNYACLAGPSVDGLSRHMYTDNRSSTVAMGRKVMAPLSLSDGTRLPAGAHVAIPTWPMKDSFYYENPGKFDGRRFLEKRSEPGNEHRWQFVTTTPEHLGFGHGQHAW